MHESIRLGTVRGIAIGVNWSVLAIAALLAWGLADGYLPEAAPGHGTGAYWAAAVLAVVVFLGSLLAHELGHSLVAQGHGVVVEGITLWLFGGVAKLRSEAVTPQDELKIATAGPAVSILLTAVFAAVALALDAGGTSELVVETFAWLALINGILAVFNLAPAAPLDGGRVLHALVWRWSHSRARATRVSTTAGRTFGYLMVGVGIALVAVGYLGGAWIALIGWFVISAANAEATHALLQGALADVRIRDVMTPRPITVPASMPVDALLEHAFLAHHCSAFPVVDDAGRPVGLVTLRRLRSLPVTDRVGRTAGDIAIPVERAVVVHPDDALVATLEHLAPDAPGDGRMLVFDGPVLVGIVSPTDIHRALELASLRGDVSRGTWP